MNFLEYKVLVKKLTVGKQLPDSTYIHNSALSAIPPELAAITFKVADALKIPDDAWNIAKYYKQDFKIALLNYPDFEADAYPALHQSYTIDLQKLSLRKADYSSSDNPPILHRKETFVLPSHPLFDVFCQFTKEGEKLGLYDNTRTIGFRKNWLKLIAQKGRYIDSDGHLKPLDVKHPVTAELATAIDRHKTAIDRNKLSAPMQILARHNYLNGDYSVLDYGCGKGDDVRELEAHGLNVSGWDPVHNPEGQLLASDIVNLGFVLNVIEEQIEREETLHRAFSYADKLLIVSVMIGGESLIAQFQPYKDGIVTSRNTFQKYYSQGEIRLYIERVLEESVVAVGQGIFIVFKDKLEEQIFLIERQHIRRDWQQKTERIRVLLDKPAAKELIEKHAELFSDYWQLTLDLGRIPAAEEFEFSKRLQGIAGSYKKAHELVIDHFGPELFEESKRKRQEDLLVYFALAQFERRKRYSQMPESLKRDIKAFFSSFNDAQEEATKLLFSVGQNEVIEAACNKAYEALGVGEMYTGHSYIFHKKYLSDMPPELRVFVGCATQLYGDLDGIHLIKAHMTSGKVTLLRYDDWEKEEPLLLERIKIKLREQDVDFFRYSNDPGIQTSMRPKLML
jgi:DNA phosphorothioation-associated putative methyltransferase